MNRMPRLIAILLLASLLLGTTAGCRSVHQPEHTYVMASLDHMPAAIQSAPVLVQQAYQFAEANPEVLSQLPCYCGCGAMGHTSNYSCYISGTDENGRPLYDTHALGCSICVDITQDAMRLLNEGQSVSEILTYVNNTYARYGPPTPGQ